MAVVRGLRWFGNSLRSKLWLDSKRELENEMRHAIMVLGSGDNSEVLQKTIDHLDDPEIDFFIHWNLKYELPKLNA